MLAVGFLLRNDTQEPWAFYGWTKHIKRRTVDCERTLRLLKETVRASRGVKVDFVEKLGAIYGQR